MIFDDKHLLFDINVKNQREAFEQIANLAKKLNITNNPKGLVEDLLKREKISTTGMADQVAIPHAMNADFKEAGIIVCRFKNAVDWNSVGGEPVKVAFALLIPEKSRGTLHMQYLQNIATALLDKEFNKIILTSKNRNEIIKTISKAVEGKKETIQETNHNSKGLIVGVSACATGVAHTYMAREALEKHAKDVGYDVWIETQGQSGQEHKLSEDQIKKADSVVIAADINVPMERFEGKKYYSTDTNEAINTPVETLNKTINSKNIFNGSSGGDTFSSKNKKGFMKHFLNGVSHMIPFIVFSGIVWAILQAIAMGIWQNHDFPNYKDNPAYQNSPFHYAVDAGGIGFTFYIAIMGGFIGVSIAGRAALAPCAMATFAASTPSFYIFYKGLPKVTPLLNAADPSSFISGVSLSIIAALIMGFAGGYLVNWVNSWKVSKHIKPLMPIIFIPVVCTSVLIFPFLFAFSGILGCFMNYFAYGLAWISTAHPGMPQAAAFIVDFLLGCLLGAMIGFDMGGPINKIAGATATALIQIDPRLLGAVEAAIPIAPLGCAFASLVIGRRLFNEQERALGASALGLGFFGISEGSIPFFSNRPKKTLIPNIIGSAIAGGLAFLFFIGGHVGMWGGPIVAFVLGIHADPGQVGTVVPSIFGGGDSTLWNYFGNIIWFFIAIIAGMLIHSIIYVVLISKENGATTKEALKSIFSRKKKESNHKEIKRANKFINWYQENLVVENWYYQTKVLNKPYRYW